MKYQWLHKEQTCDELSAELGFEIASITRGDIVVGYEEGRDEAGKKAQVPIIRRGIEIEFRKEPTAEQLARLDLMLPDLRRAGGKTLAERVQEVADRVAELERKSTERA